LTKLRTKTEGVFYRKLLALYNISIFEEKSILVVLILKSFVIYK